MTEDEFEHYLQSSLNEMNEKQDKLEKEFGLGHYERFTVDYETLMLSFYDNEQKIIDVSIIPIASHVPEKEDLKWAWANESYPLEIRKKSEIMKELAQMTGFEMFNNPSVECDEDMALARKLDTHKLKIKYH